MAYKITDYSKNKIAELNPKSWTYFCLMTRLHQSVR